MNARERLVRWATGAPLDLAVFRVVVALVVFGSVDLWEARSWVGAAVAPPAGWGLVGALLPPSEPLASVVTWGVALAALLTLVGFYTRVAAACGAVGLVWLLAVPQFSGQVLHTHHLVWFFALVAAGPSGDVWSIDAWRAGGAPPPPSLAHGLPVRFAWLTIGLLFFFPGVWKLVHLGAWLEALPGLVAWKRFQLGLSLPGPLPAALLKAGGALAVLLEVSLLPLLLFRRTRVRAAVAAVLFHLGVQWVMGIGFSSLWLCYLACGDWAEWLRHPLAPAPGWRGTAAPLAVGGALLVGLLVTGVAGREDTWPVACYPTFRFPAPAVVRWVEIDELAPPGARLDLSALRASQRWWGLSTRAAASPTRASVEALHRQWRGEVEVPAAKYFLVTWRPASAAPPERAQLP